MDYLIAVLLFPILSGIFAPVLLQWLRLVE
jgi:hypothetical protein